MRLTRTFVASLAVLLTAAGAARAQETLFPPPHPAAESWPVAPEPAQSVWIEGFVSRQRGNAVGRTTEGLGGRVLWSLAPRVRVAEPDGRLARLAERLAVGAFAVRTTPRGRLEAWHLGAQADGSLLPRPLLGRVEPLVSLGVGAYRERLPGRRTADVPAVVLRRPREDGIPILPAVQPPRTLAHGAVAPGAALRVRLLRGVAVRGDARRVLVFDDPSPRSAMEYTAGLSVAR